METQGAKDQAYSVLCFSLARGGDGKPTQHSKVCGAYNSIEEAFQTARLLAVTEWHRLFAKTPANPGDKSEKIQIKDTEWGYDLRRGNLVVTRYWVHDKSASTLG